MTISNLHRHTITRQLAALFLLVPAFAFASGDGGPKSHEMHMKGMKGSSCCDGDEAASDHSGYDRSMVHVTVPDVSLVDASGTPVSLRSALAEDGEPIMLNFIFTSCTTICPVLTATFSKVDRELGGHDNVRLISITIDPEHDTPERLREYAKQHGADARWQFFTGSPKVIEAVQKAFGAYRGSKFNHAPLTYIHKPGEDQWIKLEGLGDAVGLWAEYQRPTEAR